ncbi:UDP-N-acetylglucosamine 2-epimerase (hydrolyzing) [Myroides marinus]|uniref:UDP-N-acetylglucosamine 2-epimerase n=1 Tax=Myroides marinus TaxID=703342 RepID=UPI002575DC27|nr:UDP-N-acetylglucosamine 2-epimerase [Myroides marinus]MDM1352181.1 UDP-N-acetylglucosamine 2-epimerase (hydrolyzing) [Myroides marinus]MDM1359380.1 UDP-N-acetylglucosamine 2-epimerase (hydrolyzing) [Myroides marinus]MDM1366511.1 UDP-N-acetylglucosamine 2-epimerase (hydrolyzing) [Myroides marinus]
MKKICVTTATRAEYGLLRPLIKAIHEHPEFQLQLLVTGAHLSPEFGLTKEFIIKDGYIIDEEVEMLLSSDTAVGVSKSMGLGLIGYAEAFKRLQADAVIILGDRYEMLAMASAAIISKLPIIHLHGGEITEGAYDDAIRHAITKLSYLHFTSTEEYRRRVIQMGEHPERVYNVGAIGIDNINELPLLSRAELEESLGVKFKRNNYQITFHPETLSNISSEEQFKNLLEALDQLEDSFFVFTKANADTDGRVINRLIDEYVVLNKDKAVAFHSLGALRFLSLVKMCDAIIGNSSSGILEAPSLFTATINIGDRQKGRIQAKSIINCDNSVTSILNAIVKSKEAHFKMLVSNVLNPYDNGGAVDKIIQVLEDSKDKFKVVKHFNDIV